MFAVDSKVAAALVVLGALLVTAPDRFSATYVPLIRIAEGRGAPRSFNVLSAAPRR